jgi:hypothetical protein
MLWAMSGETLTTDNVVISVRTRPQTLIVVLSARNAGLGIFAGADATRIPLSTGQAKLSHRPNTVRFGEQKLISQSGFFIA